MNFPQIIAHIYCETFCLTVKSDYFYPVMDLMEEQYKTRVEPMDVVLWTDSILTDELEDRINRFLKKVLCKKFKFNKAIVREKINVLEEVKEV